MSGEDLLSAESCPECGADLDSISDGFRGDVSALDNFDEVEEYLRSEGILSTDHYDLYADRFSRDEYNTSIANSGIEVPDGPFVTELIFCTEAWCTSDSCDFTRRTYTPPSKVTSDLGNTFTDDPDEIELSEEAKREYDQLMDALSN